MDDYLPHRIHSTLREARRRNWSPAGSQYPAKPSKKYPRMPQVPLATCELSGIDLSEATLRRFSCREYSATMFPAADAIGKILHLAASAHEGGKRRYPSGGAFYPIETYLLVRNADGLEAGTYHYRPDTHALEYLWKLPEETHEEKSGEDKPLSEIAPILFVFTSTWEKNTHKYHEFGYELALLEVGHLAQNILLGCAAFGLGACALGGFDDEALAKLYDLDLHIEQPVYAIAVGVPRE